MKRALRVGIAATALAFAWQWLTVQYNYRGNWTALFCTGSDRAVPPFPEFRNTYVFQNSLGYDGEYYRYFAHDPFFQRGLARFVDAPRLRAPRVLVPVLAYAMGLGRPTSIDTAYYAVVLLFVFLGAAWVARYAEQSGSSAWWGLGFLLVPAVLISLDRMTVDLALTALVCGWACTWGRGKASGIAGYAILIALPLARETGLLISLATAAVEVRSRQFRALVLWACTLIPFAGWYLFVSKHVSDIRAVFLGWPFRGMIIGMGYPNIYPPGVPFRQVVIVLDYVARAGIVMAMILAVREWWRRRDGALEIGMLAFTVLGILISRLDIWSDSFGFGRAFAPLLVLVALRWFDSRRFVYLLPTLLVTIRVMVQLAPQVLGILHLR